MYQYDDFDDAVVRQRITQFKGQIERRISGELTEDQFKPLRLMNGVYLQLHAYMLRVAIPYGTLSSVQLRQLAMIADKYDKGFGHITTRQNIQFNWPKLVDIPAILSDLADVEMHAIQTSGNCIRNVTTDQFAGVAEDEIIDPRGWCEILRQWSTFHPEFTFLPRKFKIAVSGAKEDRAAVRVHDIGLQIVENEAGEIGFQVFVGGGLGRSPYVGKEIIPFISEEDLLPYLEAILRAYNKAGRRDNIYKARIKILVDAVGIDGFRELVAEEFKTIDANAINVPEVERTRIKEFFKSPDFKPAIANEDVSLQSSEAFAFWVSQNVTPHKQVGYKVATISLKPNGMAPGDITSAQMRKIADLAEAYSFGEIRTTHEQNIVLPHIHEQDLFTVWEALSEVDLATPNAGLISDIIACPGLDYCNLANTRSIPIANRIQEKFHSLQQQADIGELKIKISGCINACGHHHVGHIGILGVDRKGEEFYQITMGGSANENASIGEIVGKGLSTDEIISSIEKIVQFYLEERKENEPFIETYRRLGAGPFKEVLYAA